MALATLPDVFTLDQVNTLIGMLPQAEIRIDRFETTIRVKIVKNDRTVLSALKPTRRNAWHVMAAEGLFTRTTKS